MQKRIRAFLGACALFSVFIFTLQNIPQVRFIEGISQNLGIAPKSFIFLWSHSGSRQNSEVAQLEKENATLTQKFVDYENMKKDNDALRSQFQDTAIPSTHLLPADIIGFAGIASHPTTFFINRGKDNKLYQGMIVIVGHNLIGKIQNVSDHISSVQTLYDKNFTVLGKTLRDSSSGVIQGEDDFILMSQVVITDKLTKGDLVKFSGDKNFPKESALNSIIVGKIGSIAKSETAPFQSAKIDSLIDYSKTSKVFVVISE